MDKTLVTDLLCAALALMLLWAAVVDIRTRTIANGLNLAIALMAPVFWWVMGVDLWPDAATRVGVAVAVGVAIGVSVGTTVGVTVGVGVAVAVAVALEVPVGVGVESSPGPPTQEESTSDAAMAMITTKGVRMVASERMGAVPAPGRLTLSEDQWCGRGRSEGLLKRDRRPGLPHEHCPAERVDVGSARVVRVSGAVTRRP